MYLHQAIYKLLKEANRPMPAKEIAHLVNNRNWYQRKNKKLIKSSHIYARIAKYPDLFAVDKSTKPRTIFISNPDIDIPESDVDTRIYRDLINKGEDDFEKNIVYISAGTLVLSLTFIEKIVGISGAVNLWTLILSWCLLAFSLITNLISHLISIKFNSNVESMVYNNIPPDTVNHKINKYNKTMTFINWFSVGALIGGIIFLILYCSLNALRNI